MKRHTNTFPKSFLSYGLLDNLYMFLNKRFNKSRHDLFFSKGLGDVVAMKFVQEKFVSQQPAAKIEIHWETNWQTCNGYYCRDGFFETPFFHSYLPDSCKKAYFRLIHPLKNNNPPIYLHMATTGEEGYKLRETKLAIPLSSKLF